MPPETATCLHDLPPPATRTPAPLPFEDRLVLRDAEMTVRLDHAAQQHEITTAHLEAPPLDLAEVITTTLPEAPRPLPDLYPTPVAALLQRAHHRLATRGWCAHAMAQPDGARCLLGALHTEARGDTSLEAAAENVLMDAIRRDFGDVRTVPAFNDRWPDGEIPMRLLDQAAHVADARGL